MLLGRGFGLAGASPLTLPLLTLPELEFCDVSVGLALGRIDARGAAGRTETLDGRADGVGRFGVVPPAADAGREGGLAFCPNDPVELLRERPGSFGAVGGRTTNDII
jgi:hypothetical protein